MAIAGAILTGDWDIVSPWSVVAVPEAYTTMVRATVEMRNHTFLGEMFSAPSLSHKHILANALI